MIVVVGSDGDAFGLAGHLRTPEPRAAAERNGESRPRTSAAPEKRYNSLRTDKLFIYRAQTGTQVMMTTRYARVTLGISIAYSSISSTIYTI